MAAHKIITQLFAARWVLRLVMTGLCALFSVGCSAESNSSTNNTDVLNEQNQADTTQTDPTPTVECSSAEECPASEGCRINSGICDSCRIAKECRAGQSCVGGVCGNCTQDTDCEGGLCEAGACEPCTPGADDTRCAAGYDESFTCQPSEECAPDGCLSGSDCTLVRLVCLDNACSACTSTSDCLSAGVGDYPLGTSCVDGICIEGNCDQDSRCPLDQPICGDRKTCRGCQRNEECLRREGAGEGFVCDIETGRCETGDCFPTQSTCGGQICGDDLWCRPCADNAECNIALGSAFLCVEGTCQELECNDTRPCALGRACDEDLNICRDCRDNKDCGDNMVCDLGDTGRCFPGDCTRSTEETTCSDSALCDIQTMTCVDCNDANPCGLSFRGDPRVCIDGSCVLGECTTATQNDDCVSNLCVDNYCVDCVALDGCGAERICNINTHLCTEGDCVSNNHCGIFNDLEQGWICDQSSCRACSSDDDCVLSGYPTNSICEAGSCVVGCGENGDCDSQLCVNNRCTTCTLDGNCGGGRECDEPNDGGSGHCFIGSCAEDSDCALAQPDPCQRGECLQSAGRWSCFIVDINEGQSCDADGFACTINGTCNTGVCEEQNTCTDNFDCTQDICTAQGCTNNLNPGRCLVDGVCYQDGDPDPNNPCQECQSSFEATSWTFDNANSCGGAGLRCRLGICETLCGLDDWVDLAGDENNCGACDRSCSSAQICTDAVCGCASVNGAQFLNAIPWLPTNGQAIFSQVEVEFTCAIDPTTFNANTVLLHAQSSISAAFDTSNPLRPVVLLSRALLPGEHFSMTITNGVQDSLGQPTLPWVLHLTHAPTLGSSAFTASPALNDVGEGQRVALGDVDGDGDLDAWIANNGQPDTLYINTAGVFSNSGQAFASEEGRAVRMGDLDGDGDLDVVVANNNEPSVLGAGRIWTNDGSGVFNDSGQTLGNLTGHALELGDLDGDGDLDIFALGNNFISQPGKVWLNDGNGLFSDAGQNIGIGKDVALGDLDADGDLDAFVTIANNPNLIWINDGLGGFSPSGVAIGNSDSHGVALGDLDGDGDLDAFVANRDVPNLVWLNDGRGAFSNTTNTLGAAKSRGVALGDLDADGDLDAFVTNQDQANTIWLNDGNGIFTDSPLPLGLSRSRGVALGDLDGDGDLDAFIANDTDADLIWHGQ